MTILEKVTTQIRLILCPKMASPFLKKCQNRPKKKFLRAAPLETCNSFLGGVRKKYVIFVTGIFRLGEVRLG